MARYLLCLPAAMTTVLSLAGCQNPSGPVGPWDGFEGVRWGDPPARAAWLVKDGETYVPKGRTVGLAGVPATSAKFTFSKNLGFAEVELRFGGRTDFEAVLKHLTGVYGPGTPPPTRGRPSTIAYTWEAPAGSGKGVMLSLWYDPRKDECGFFMGNAKMIEIPY